MCIASIAIHSLEDKYEFSKHKQEENVSKIELQIRFFQL